MTRETGVKIQETVFEEVLTRQKGICFGCASALQKDKITIQHMLAKSLGGTNETSNLLAMCQKCHGHSLKSLRLPNYLISQIEAWKQENEITSSLSTLLRHAIVNQMRSNYVDIDEYRRMNSEIQKLRKEVEKKDKEIKSCHKILENFGEQISSQLPYVDLVKSNKWLRNKTVDEKSKQHLRRRY